MIKLCDFGWSISSKTMRETFCGTPLYVSPELLKRKNYNNKIDVWSVGILTYELLFGRVPFEITTERDFIKIVTLRHNLGVRWNKVFKGDKDQWRCKIIHSDLFEKGPQRKIHSTITFRASIYLKSGSCFNGVNVLTAFTHFETVTKILVFFILILAFHLFLSHFTKVFIFKDFIW